MATDPGVRFRRNASRPTGAPNTNIPYKKETADGRKRRSTTSALTISGPLSLALIIVILTLTFLFSLAACATVDSLARDDRTSAGAPLTLLPKDTSRLEVLALNEILGGSVPESLEMQFEAQWGAYSLGGVVIFTVIPDIHRHSRESGNPKAIGSKCVFASYRILDSRESGNDGNRRLGTDFLKLTTFPRGRHPDGLRRGSTGPGCYPRRRSAGYEWQPDRFRSNQELAHR